MSNESEKFDELRKLLALKRHEQPPPGFFRDLPGRVLMQIEQEESVRPGWWARLREAFELRPALSVGFAGGLCCLLVAGVYHGQKTGSEAEGGLAVSEPREMSSEVNNPFNVSTGEMSRPPVGIFDPQVGGSVERAGFQTNANEIRP